MADIDVSRAKEIFGEALELDGEARGRYLDRACAGDAALRKRVMLLLTAAEKGDRFLSDATLGAVPPANAGTHAEGAGSRIGPYHLLQLIGEGGFGSVFMADQERPVQRRVALKIIKLGMDTRAVVARFEQERQALAVLDHPNIAKVFDAGATETGRPYFVMELVKGQPITEYCDRCSLTVAERLELFTQVCAAVQHAHTKGIIHRDLKPSNILVTETDGRPTARIIDFGIAKATERRLTELTLFTEFHQIVGTPEYMSPEQAAASVDIDTRTDIYSLGVILYELLTGATPFDPRRLRSAAFHELQRIIREDDPPKPSTRLSQSLDTIATVAARRRTEPRRLNLLLRGELDWIVMKSLEKDRARRYDSPGALSADVSRYLAGDAVTAAPPTAAYRLRKFTRRHRGSVVAVSLVALALVAGLVVAGVGLVQANEARRLEHELREVADRQAAIAQTINRFLNDMLSKADRGAQGGNPDVKVRDVLDSAAADLAAGHGPADPEVRASLLDTIGRTYTALGLYDQAIPRLRGALDLRRQALGPDNLLVADSMRALGTALTHHDELPEAIALSRELLAMRRRLLGDSHRDVAGDMVNLAVALDAARDLDAAEPLFRDALAILRLDPETNADALADALTDYGLLCLHRRDFARADGLLREALERRRAIDGPASPRVATILNNLAWVCTEKEDFTQAESLYHQCVEMRRRLLGPTHPLVATTINNLAGTLQRAHKADAAEPLFRESLDIRRKALGEEDPVTIGSIENLANDLQSLGRLDEAEKLYDQSLALRRKVLGDTHPDVADSLGNLGSLKADQGRLDEAESLFRQALDIRLKHAADHPDTVVALTNLAITLTRERKFDEAEPLVRRALEIQKRILPPGHPAIAQATTNLGIFLAARGDNAGAEPVLREALRLNTDRYGAADPRTVSAASGLGAVLGELAWALPEIGAAKAAEAVTLLRGVLAARADLHPGDPSLEQCRITLAGALIASAACDRTGEAGARIASLTEAESLLTRSHEALAAAAPPDQPRLHQCAVRFTRLYETWNRIDPGAGVASKAAEWKER